MRPLTVNEFWLLVIAGLFLISSTFFCWQSIIWRNAAIQRRKRIIRSVRSLGEFSQSLDDGNNRIVLAMIIHNMIYEEGQP